MPYSSLKDVPESVKKLSEKKQAQWLAVFNSAWTAGKEAGKSEKELESSSFAQAWGVIKDEGKKADVQTSMVVIIKSYNAPQRLFYGIVYEPDTVDTHGDFTSAEEIEKAAHNFLPSAVMNIHHKDDLDVEKVQVVESYITPETFSINDCVINKGSWVLVSRILDDELAAAIENGEITGYSMEGTATKIEF
jgi:cation transport regulator ChaB